MRNTPATQQRATILNAVKALCIEGEVYEVRIVNFVTQRGFKKTYSGYFDDIERLSSAAAEIDNRNDGTPEAIYITLNPVPRDLLARANNRLKERPNATTADTDITDYRTILIDCDPVRPSGISSTDDELDASITIRNTIVDYLRDQWNVEPVITAMSGNGAHALYAVNFPATSGNTNVLRRFLNALDQQFSNSSVTVDTSVFNPSRITKLYGTWARKGDNTTTRPHRQSCIEMVNERVEVSLDQIAAIADEYVPPVPAVKPDRKQSKGTSNTDPVAYVEGFISKHGITINKEKIQNGRRIWRLETCPFCGESDKSAVITVSSDNTIGYKCHHNRCTGKGWAEFRQYYEPGCYDQQYTNGSNGIHRTNGSNGSNGVHRSAVTTNDNNDILVPSESVQNGNGNRYRFLDSNELANLEPPVWLVNNIICLGEVTMINGPSDSGKTFVTVDIANRVAQHYPVCYVAAEDVHGIKMRWNAWHKKFNKPYTKNFFTLAEPLNLSDIHAVTQFVKEATKYRFRMVVIDTLSQCVVGVEENSNRDMGIVMANLNSIAHHLDAAVVAIHHTGKGNNIYRGAGVIKANSYGFLTVRREDDHVILSCDRIKNSPGFADMYLRLVKAGESCVLMTATNVRDRNRLTPRAVSMLEEITLFYNTHNVGIQTTKLQENLGLKGNSYYAPLKLLRKKGFIRDGSPLTPTQAGQDYLTQHSCDPDYKDENESQENSMDITINTELPVTTSHYQQGGVTPIADDRNFSAARSTPQFCGGVLPSTDGSTFDTILPSTSWQQDNTTHPLPSTTIHYNVQSSVTLPPYYHSPLKGGVVVWGSSDGEEEGGGSKLEEGGDSSDGEVGGRRMRSKEEGGGGSGTRIDISNDITDDEKIRDIIETEYTIHTRKKPLLGRQPTNPAEKLALWNVDPEMLWKNWLWGTSMVGMSTVVATAVQESSSQVLSVMRAEIERRRAIPGLVLSTVATIPPGLPPAPERILGEIPPAGSRGTDNDTSGRP